MNYWGQDVQIARNPTNPADCDRSTSETLGMMRQLVWEAMCRPEIAAVADRIIRQLPRKPTQKQYAEKVFWWVKNTVRFKEDEPTVSEMGYADANQELLIAPWVLVSMPQPRGDCDDFSMLAASLLKAGGIPCAFVAVAVDRNEPWRWSHVFCTALVDGEKTTVDCSHGKWLGWESARQQFRRMEWPI